MYRADLLDIEGRATPAPWRAEGEYFGVDVDGGFRALGFAPHHPRDPELIAAYRNALAGLVRTLATVEQQLLQASRDDRNGAGVAVLETLSRFDEEHIDGAPLTAYLSHLDDVTTQPLWDPGHLAMSMDILAHLDGVERVRPRDADPALIAAARSAVPRCVQLLTYIAAKVSDTIRADGSVPSSIAARLCDDISALDSHRVDEGVGTGTV